MEKAKARHSFRGGLFFIYTNVMEQQKQRVIVYIDGFNFYFGLKHNAKWKKYYWLDIVKLFESFMRPNQELVCGQVLFCQTR